jgi:dTDP-glucose pyrophosphorylase
MRNWKDIRISPTTSVRDTLRVIDAGSAQIALVTDDSGRLVGTVTDGDVRRGLLRNIGLDGEVMAVMNTTPTVARSQDSIDEILAVMKLKQLRHIPVVDPKGHLVGLEVLEELIQASDRPNWVVLMAGGFGTRLRPLTDDCPKPLLKVGNKPLLQTILENFIQYGFHRFFISVNYKAEMVKDHFADGSSWGVQIEYLHETERLGTAGSLSLLPSRPEHPLFVMNGDLLTKVNFQHMLDFHTDHSSEATMCVRDYEFQVPYGVVRIGQQEILAIEEKPIQRFFVNAGIYVLNPGVLDLIPGNDFFDMTTLLQHTIDAGKRTAVFPIREYWLDIGQMDDFRRANGDFGEQFP